LTDFRAMNQGKYVFSQLVSFVSHNDFNVCVSRYKGDFKTKDFSCWKQFLCMSFGQLTHRESLSDTITCLAANKEKLYHLGIGRSISKSTLSKANENRDWRIYADFAMMLIAQAKILYINDSFLEVSLKQNVFAIDATVIDLCLSIFPWATFRKTKAAIKIHTQLNLKNNIPELVIITAASVHELNILDLINFEPGSFYVFDRGYIDYPRLYKLHCTGAYFIIRARGRMRFLRQSSNPVNKSSGIRVDQSVKIKNFYPHKNYPENLRRIIFVDETQEKKFEFLTNNFDLPAIEIAQLYKHRWMIELFFKWIKQHLKIKSFWGYSQNAVKSQIWIAVSVYVLVAIVKKRLGLKHSLYEILQILSINIFDKMPINQLFDDALQQNFKELKNNQLKIFD
jgi:hypothetical protein